MPGASRLVCAALFVRHAKYTESNVEQPAESSARSIVEQLAQTFASIEALNWWLKMQSDASSGADFQRLRAAVAILTTIHRNP